jgi:hypothetical protein
MQGNLKSLQDKIFDLETKLNRVNVEDSGNSMISGIEHSSILAGQGNNPNVIRDIQLPNQQQLIPQPILKNKENTVPPLSPINIFNFKESDPYNEPRGGQMNTYNNTQQ